MGRALTCRTWSTTLLEVRLGSASNSLDIELNCRQAEQGNVGGGHG